jgi:hypothetical protein
MKMTVRMDVDAHRPHACIHTRWEHVDEWIKNKHMKNMRDEWIKTYTMGTWRRVDKKQTHDEHADG